MTLDEFKNGINWLMSNPDGCVNFKVGKTPDDKDIAIVIGWDDACGIDGDSDIYYLENHYILSAKVAYNCDDLQCDYGWDWYMPEVKGTNDVLDTGLFLSKNLEDLKNDYSYICELANKVLDGYKNGDLA